MSKTTLLWEGYGLSNPFSGIGRHATQLNHALQEFGVQPILVHPNLMSHLQLPTLFHRPRVFGKWGHTGGRRAFVDSLTLAEPIVTHGLSNFNVLDRQDSLRVLTIHDLIPLLNPSKSLYSLQMAHFLPKAVQIADRIICVSLWTLESCKKFFPQFQDKFVYIPNGVSQINIVPRGTLEFTRLLVVSRWEQYKGFPKIISILRQLDRKNTSTDWVTNQKGYLWLKRSGGDLLDSGKIRVHIELGDDSLANLYKQATMLLHCSDYEGYCLPASEAMSYGVPVLYLKGSGIDEVVATGGIGMKQSHTPGDWCDAINEVADHSSRWQKQVATEFRKKPSWSDVAKATLSVYNGFSS